MTAYLQNAQAEVATLDAQVIDKLSALNAEIGTAMTAGATNEKLDAARETYAVAAYYRAYILANNDSTPVVQGGRGEEAGETVAHNPQMSREYLERAIALLDDAMATLA